MGYKEQYMQWLESDYMDEATKEELRQIHQYWKGRTTSELATSYMAPEAIKAIEHNIFTPGNYFYNG